MLFSLLLAAVLATADTTATDVQEINHLEAAWNDAHLAGDVAALDQLFAPDFTLVVPKMPRMTKRDVMDMWHSSKKMKFSTYATMGMKIRVYGDAAVVTGTMHRSRVMAGLEVPDDWLYTKVYVRNAGKWQVVAFHASDVPQ
jgi:uncharacterized protein (TIGR02246 family)